MKLHTIDTGFFKLDGGAMFGVVPKSMWQKLNPPDDKNLCTWAMRCLLIEEGNRLILVDTGIGNKQDEKFFGHYYLHGDATLDSSLAKIGFNRSDITDVFLTHLHFDHCGGAIERRGDQLLPAFKNASFWSNEAHWQWATVPNDREKASFLKDNILPIQASGQLQFVKGLQGGSAAMTSPTASLPRLPFTGNINICCVNGHTESQMLPMIQYKGKTIVYVADLLPSIGHIPLPYVMAYDTRPLLTLNEKKLFLEEAVQNDYILMFEHDPSVECCTLEMTDRGIRAKDTFLLSDI